MLMICYKTAILLDYGAIKHIKNLAFHSIYVISFGRVDALPVSLPSLKTRTQLLSEGKALVYFPENQESDIKENRQRAVCRPVIIRRRLCSD